MAYQMSSIFCAVFQKAQEREAAARRGMRAKGEPARRAAKKGNRPGGSLFLVRHAVT
jgi:hypothetical protein